jgi:hypothetical protein
MKYCLVFAFSLLLVIFAPPLRAEDQKCSNAGLSRAIEEFEVQGPLAEALFNLGKKTNICFALRSPDQRAFTVHLTLKHRSTNARNILMALTEQLPEYSFRVEADVVAVGRLGSVKPSSVFDKPISFTAPRAPLRAVLNGLAMQVAVDYDPSIKGFAGHFFPGDLNNQVGPIDEHQRSLSAVLNSIIGASQGAMWLAAVPEDGSLRASPLQLWRVIEYQDNQEAMQLLLTETLQSLRCHDRATKEEKARNEVPIRIRDIRNCQFE